MQFEVLYQELAHGAAMIQALVTGVTPEQARVKPSPEEWSVLEVVCHLVDEERRDFKQHLHHILNQPEHPQPPNDTQVGPYNERNFAQSLDAFLQERSRSLAWLKELSAPDWNSSIVLTFGPDDKLTVTAGDMLAAWVAHDNLHMRQLVELRRARLVHLAEPYDVRYAGAW